MSTSKTQGFSLLRTLCIGLGLLGMALPALGQTPTYTVIHPLRLSEGISSYGTLIQGTDGNFYGTMGGGAYPYNGMVVKITPDGVLTALYSFNGPPADGSGPLAGLIQGTDGNFYGTTYNGGASDLGTVFMVTPDGRETILHSFQGGSDGTHPLSGLVQATDGNFYGTTPGGGTYNRGKVYKITPDGTQTVIHSFDWYADGAYPQSGLIQGTDGSLYGTASNGGAYDGRGTVYKITLDGVLTLLHSFQSGSDGGIPFAGLIQGTDGNFYGTTYYGGAYELGTVFMVTPDGRETVLHSFQGMPDGAHPWAALVQGADGQLYGTTVDGGNAGGESAQGLGTIFRVTLSKEETILYPFQGGLDGSQTYAGLVQGKDGNFYGTTKHGGAYDYGTVFRLSGVYPLPVITCLLPAICSAGGPDFTLTVKGTGFQTFSTVNWNGTPLTTSYVSATELKARVPASLIASVGTAAICVVTGAGGGTSNTRNLSIRQTILKLALTSLTKNSDGSFTATISLTNTGYQSAVTILLKRATLGAATTSASLPQSLGTLAAGATGATSLTFPASAGSSGTAVRLRVSGTFTGGSFWYMQKVKLP